MQKNVRIITGAQYRAHTTLIFKHLHFLKLVDLYQLQGNKYVLSFLEGLLPSTLNTYLDYHKNTGHSDSIQINGANNTYLGCVPKHHLNVSSNMEPFDAGHLYAQLIAHIFCGFIIQIQTIHTGGLR